MVVHFYSYYISGRRNVTPKVAPDEEGSTSAIVRTEAINQQPGRGRTTNRYNLKFQTETKEEIEARKKIARETIIPEPVSHLEMGTDFCFIPGLEFPQRPRWDYNLSHQVLVMFD